MKKATWILLVVVAASFLLIALTACYRETAKDFARRYLGPNATCIGSSDELAYCTVKHKTWMCDKEDCVLAPPPGQVMLKLDADRQRQADEDAQRQLQQQQEFSNMPPSVEE